MTESQDITTAHLRDLLDSRHEASIIALLGGKVAVLEGDGRDDIDDQGALKVISRAELEERLGNDPGDDELSAQAAALTMAFNHIGG
ncbi:MAG: hypothetical protein JWQ59_669 [Cryobacterium sp.]|nr:hypothetical protein [Cryobacterium sp.]